MPDPQRLRDPAVKRDGMRAAIAWSVAALLLTSAAAAPARAAASDCGARRVALNLALPGFDSPAELTLPQTRPRAAVVLVHGSDVQDLDGAILFKGAVVSHPLRTIARSLACRGVASLRYDKRFVTGPTTVDAAAFAKLTLQDFAADATRALDAAEHRPELADAPIFLLGWSEGAVVASEVAVHRPELAGLVLLAPVATSFAATLQRQWPTTARPYVERYATAGAVDAAAVAAAAAGPGGVVAQIYVGFLKGFAPDSRLNGMIDRNHDGRIDLAQEADPTFRGWFADGPDSGLGIYASQRALPGVATVIDRISAPILVLQGERDGNVDPAAARSLAGRPRVSARMYATLGHSLGAARSPQEDAFADPAPAPLHDLADWILKRARR